MSNNISPPKVVSDVGVNYSESRYLLLYLQEQGKLRDFYKAFTKDQKTDPTGVETLKKILGEDDLGVFQKRWEQWVLKLHFP